MMESECGIKQGRTEIQGKEKGEQGQSNGGKKQEGRKIRGSERETKEKGR